MFMRPDHGRMAPWGPCETDASVVAAHDMGFYEALWSLTMLGIFLYLDRIPRKPGIYAPLLGTAYGFVRFFMDFLRPEWTDVRYLGLTPAQYWSVIFFVVFGAILIRQLRSDAEPYWTLEGAKQRAEEAAAGD